MQLRREAICEVLEVSNFEVGMVGWIPSQSMTSVEGRVNGVSVLGPNLGVDSLTMLRTCG